MREKVSDFVVSQPKKRQGYRRDFVKIMKYVPGDAVEMSSVVVYNMRKLDRRGIETMQITAERSLKEEELLLEQVLERFRGKPGALIQALHSAQNVVGYLPPWVLKKVSQVLDVPLSEVYGVVTFYHFFSMKPRGRHVIQVCLGTACYVRGGQEILERLKKELQVEVGGVTPDGLYSLEVMRCAGACGLAPVMRVDNDVHKRVNPSKVIEILKDYQ